MSQQQPTMTERKQAQDESEALRTAQNAAMRAASSQMEERIQNPDFLGELQEAKVDSEKHDWVEAELGPVLAGSKILGNRDEEQHPHSRKWLNQNKRERMVAEGSPGRLLREHPSMLAVSQRKDPAHVHNNDITEPMDSEDRRVVRDAMEAATDFESMAAGGKGLEAVSTATTEARQVTNQEQESEGGIKSKVTSLYGGN
jgi:hypothetical protein